MHASHVAHGAKFTTTTRKANASRSTTRRAPTTRAAVTAPPKTLKAGVVTGQDMIDVLNHARHHGYAIPAVNCTMSPVINACLEAAKKANAPMIVQFSNGGGYFMAGKGTSNEDEEGCGRGMRRGRAAWCANWRRCTACR